MQTSRNIPNNEDYRNKFQPSSRTDAAKNKDEHSGNFREDSHISQQDETQYGKIRESESTAGTTEQRTENLCDKVKDGVRNAGEKVDEYTDRTQNKVENWADKAKNKMSELSDKVQEKIDDRTGKNNHSSATPNGQSHENQTRKGNSFDDGNNMHQGNVR